MGTRFTDVSIQKVSLGNGFFAIGTPLQDVGPIKGNAMLDITRKVAEFEAGIPQILYKMVATHESVFFKATFAALDLNLVQRVLGIGQFTSVAAGNTPVTAQATFNDPDQNCNPRGVLLVLSTGASGSDIIRDILVSPAPVVTLHTAPFTLFVQGTDYTLDFVAGMITRVAGGAISPTDTVDVAVTYAAQAAEFYTFGGLNGVDYQPARFTHFRPDRARIIVDIYRASTAGKLNLEFRETEWNVFDFQFNCIADLTRSDGNLYFAIRRETAQGPCGGTPLPA